MLSGEIARKWGISGLPDDTITVDFTGSAGQSFGSFLCKGLTFKLSGDANDYLGKGLSGGRIIITPPAEAEFRPEENIFAGNTIGYGATAGEMFINGSVGERFCVRNSGMTAVVEGVGDHCCEYMTGGRVVVLGKTGRNFAAGMSGGIAYVWDPDGSFDYYCNMDMIELTLVETAEDSEELRNLVEKHRKCTRSPVAAMLLEDWDLHKRQFLKVMPVEYKKIMG